jgi:hypothetical protein
VLRLQEDVMRWLPRAIPFFVISIAIYFVGYFGAEGLGILASPTRGLDQPALAQVVHGIGNRLSLGADGLMGLGAFLGAIKLSIAVLFAVYLVSRIRSLFGPEIDHEIVDGAVLLIVAVTIVAAAPALLDGTTDLLARYRLPLWLAGLAVTLSMIERVAAEEGESLREKARRGRFTVHDVMLPPKRNNVSTMRWDALRRSVNVSARPTR